MGTLRDRVLVIAAHPDDEVLGCGGTLLKWKDAGHEIVVAFAGEGRVGGKQAEEAEAVASKAGWKLLPFGHRQSSGAFQESPFNDNRFGPVADVARWVETVLDDGAWRSSVANMTTRVFIHARDDLNQDHAVLRHACRIAFRPFLQASRGFRELWAFEVPGSTVPLCEPTIYFDISRHWKRKAELVEMYASERRDFPHPRSVGALEAQARMRGAHSGLEMAEAFWLERWVIGQTSGTAA